MKYLYVLLIPLLGGVLWYARPVESKEPMLEDIIGRVEKVYVEDGDIRLVGRVDTGAGVASLNAEIIRIETDADGVEHVTFQIQDDERSTQLMTRPIVEWQNIKKKNKVGYIRRPVVLMKVCIAGKRIKARVNLAERDHFLYPMLVGRNVLKAGNFLIDPSRKFTGEPDCPGNARPHKKENAAG